MSACIHVAKGEFLITTTSANMAFLLACQDKRKFTYQKRKKKKKKKREVKRGNCITRINKFCCKDEKNYQGSNDQ